MHSKHRSVARPAKMLARQSKWVKPSILGEEERKGKALVVVDRVEVLSVDTATKFRLTERGIARASPTKGKRQEPRAQDLSKPAETEMVRHVADVKAKSARF